MNVQRFTLPLAEPLATAAGEISERSGFLLRCTHRGHTGLGEATSLPGWTESLTECEGALYDVRETANREGLRAALRELPRSATAARHGLSTALIDADASADGDSVAEWLVDGPPASTVPVNATVDDVDPDATADQARSALDQGFGCCKLKVGARSLEADIDRVEAARSAIGDDPELRVDANGGWSREEADRALDALAKYEVTLVEQPLPAEDLEGLARLRGGPVDVAADESLVSHSPQEIVDATAADVLVLKPMVLGGPGEAYTLGKWAREQGLDVIVTTTIDAVVARTAAVHVAAALPDVPACGLATASLLSADLGDDPAPVKDGGISVPDGPGLGLSTVNVDEVGSDD